MQAVGHPPGPKVNIFCFYPSSVRLKLYRFGKNTTEMVCVHEVSMFYLLVMLIFFTWSLAGVSTAKILSPFIGNEFLGRYFETLQITVKDPLSFLSPFN